MADTGRPINYKTEDIKEVIDQYIRFTDGRVLLNASKVAEYAQKELHLVNFKYYVINRNVETKQYLLEINRKIKDSLMNYEESKVSIFRAINLESYLTMPKDKLSQALYNLNAQTESMSEKYREIIKENMTLRCKVADTDAETKFILNKLENQLSALKEENRTLKKKLADEKEKYNNLSESVYAAWDKEAEIILKKTHVFIDNNGEKNSESAVITSPIENVLQIGFSKGKGRSKFLTDIGEID